MNRMKTPSLVTRALNLSVIRMEATVPWAELAYALPPALAHPPDRVDQDAKRRLAAR